MFSQISSKFRGWAGGLKMRAKFAKSDQTCLWHVGDGLCWQW